MPLYLIPDRHGRRIETVESSTLASAIQHASIYHADLRNAALRGAALRGAICQAQGWPKQGDAGPEVA